MSRWATTADGAWTKVATWRTPNPVVADEAREANLVPAGDLVRVVIESPLEHPEVVSVPLVDDFLFAVGAEFDRSHVRWDRIGRLPLWLSPRGHTLLVPDAHQAWRARFALVSVQENGWLEVTIGRSTLGTSWRELEGGRLAKHGPVTFDPYEQDILRPLGQVVAARAVTGSVADALRVHEAAHRAPLRSLRDLRPEQLAAVVRAFDEWERELSGRWKRAFDQTLWMMCALLPLVVLLWTKDLPVALGVAVTASVPTIGRRVTGRPLWTAAGLLGLVALAVTLWVSRGRELVASAVLASLVIQTGPGSLPVRLMFLAGLRLWSKPTPAELAANTAAAERAAHEILVGPPR